MRRTVTFYNPDTGAIRSTWSGPAHDLALNTPPGMAVADGLHSPDAKRVVDGQVVDRDDVDTSTPRAVTLGAIEAIERGSARAVREALLLLLPAGATKDRLAAADTAIAEHRKALK